VRALTLWTILCLGIAAGAVLRDAVRPCQPTVIAAPWEGTPQP